MSRRIDLVTAVADPGSKDPFLSFFFPFAIKAHVFPYSISHPSYIEKIHLTANERFTISLRKHEGIMSSSLMKCAGLAYLFTTAFAAATSKCRCYPSQSCWPTPAQWAALNGSVSGRLVATVPLGSPCHDPTYNATVCKSLQENWLWPQEQSVISTWGVFEWASS